MRKIAAPISLTRILHALQAVAVVFALTVIMLLIGPRLLGEGVIALLYLVPIAWCTVRWGQAPGVGAALTAAMCFDFLFIPPYGTFNIGSLEGWLLLLLFFAAAILVVGRIQSLLWQEQNRVRRADFLYEMVAAIASQSSREGIAGTVAAQLQQKYLAQSVQVYLKGKGEFPPVTACTAELPPQKPRNRPDRALVIVSGPAAVGEIAIWKGLVPLPAEDDPMLKALLHQTAAALERVQEGSASAVAR
jgi:K+-sensing histidine kinase KdpD